MGNLWLNSCADGTAKSFERISENSWWLVWLQRRISNSEGDNALHPGAVGVWPFGVDYVKQSFRFGTGMATFELLNHYFPLLHCTADLLKSRTGTKVPHTFGRQML